ncbi:MAG: hypothetical protein M1823_002209 [Watsoniomyces obsoletus]|nr:MAG: hypothetical protein M1823_002209 [Watsoniomyces obsoletus]
MATQATSPPTSPSPTLSARRGSPPLSLDLSSLPSLITPKPPSNTLLITNLVDPSVFRPDHLLTIRDLINQSAPIHTWAPLKSFRRIVVSFYDIDAAVRIKQVLDGEVIMGERVRVYFGEETPVRPVDQHLHAPESQKLFFISPPPSPPHGWEVRNEDPPNKQVHAEDLASALSNLRAQSQREEWSNVHSQQHQRRESDDGGVFVGRGRSGSTTMIYHPADHGNSPDLPAIAVEDLTYTPEEEPSPLEGGNQERMIHTARPPLELLQDA